MSSQHIETETGSGTRDLHRALTSLQEELEAVDYYGQRMDAAQDPELKALLEHNRDEEVEHAAMLFEWLRRKMPSFDQQLKTYLFTDAPITRVEETTTAHGTPDSPVEAVVRPDLGIGNLKTRKGL